MHRERTWQLKSKTSLMALLAITPVLPIGLAGCPCACTKYEPPPSYQPFSIVTGDFNADGVADLAIGGRRNHSNPGSSDPLISIVLQNRNAPGTFRSSIDIALPTEAWGLAVGDLDGAGGSDLVTGGESSNVVLLLQSASPPGPFAPNRLVHTGVRGVEDIAIGDLNGDGVQDMAIGDWRTESSVAVLLQNPATLGEFAAPINLSVGHRLSALTIADIDGDGHADVLVTSARDEYLFPGARLSIFFGTANSSQPFAPRIDTDIDNAPDSLHAGDLNGDGLLDIAIAHTTVRSVSVLLQDPQQSGAFLAPARYATSGPAAHLAVGDLNADGRPDLAIANVAPSSVDIFLQSATQPGVFDPAIRNPGVHLPRGIVVGNLNGDSLPDLAIADGDRATVMFNSASAPGTFSAPVLVGL